MNCAEVASNPVLDCNDPDNDWHWLNGEVHELLCAWIELHGFDRNTVCRVEYDVIDCPMLRVTQYEHDDKGMYRLVGDEVAKTVTSVALRHPLPDCWHPEVVA